jgi:hypothetical protein
MEKLIIFLAVKTIQKHLWWIGWVILLMRSFCKLEPVKERNNVIF